MDAAAYLSACLGKVLEMKGQDLFLKVGAVPRTRVGAVVLPLSFPIVTASDTEAVVQSLLNSFQKNLLEKNRAHGQKFG